MAGVTLMSGNLNTFFNAQIESVLHEYNLDLLKDRRKQQEMEQDLNKTIPVGTWSVQLTGNTIRMTLTGRDKRTKIIWSY